MIAVRYFPRPLVSLAPRDLLLAEAMPVQPADIALEIGTGSGSSLLRLAGSVAALHGVDVSPGPVERLRRALARAGGPARDVRLFAMDFCDPGAPGRLPARYDLIFSCDTVEHVSGPGAFFANLHEALKPGGRAFVTFPNEHPRRAHGITYFGRRGELRFLLEEAGFDPSAVEILSLQMSPAADRVLKLGWLWPRAAAKAALRAARGRRPRPQTFDETDFFRASERLEPVAPLINAYGWAVLGLMSLARPVYEMSPAPEIIWDTRILIRARRTAPAT